MSDTQRPSVTADLYDDRYYTLCEGYEAFLSSAGQCLPPGSGTGIGLSRRLEAALALAEVEPGMRVLDLGCGRGEVLLHCAAAGAWAWGIDYSLAAVKFAQATVGRLEVTVERGAAVQRADVKALPFPDGTFDRVLMLDLVEHLYPWELALALAEVQRVLRDGGRLVVHTMPNRLYYRFGYPLFRLLNRLRGHRLPKNPRARFEYNVHVHVNEQDVWRLRASLRQAGLAPQVRVDNLRVGALGSGWWGRLLESIIRLPGLRLVLCNDLLAVATKELK